MNILNIEKKYSFFSLLTKNLSYTILLWIAIFCLLASNVFSLVDAKSKLSNYHSMLCADLQCHELISDGITTTSYPSPEKSLLSFRKDLNVKIFGKTGDKHYFFVEVNKKRGFVPAKLIKETKVHFEEAKLSDVNFDFGAFERSKSSSVPGVVDKNDSNTVPLSSSDNSLPDDMQSNTATPFVYSQKVTVIDGTTIDEDLLATTATPSPTFVESPVTKTATIEANFTNVDVELDQKTVGQVESELNKEHGSLFKMAKPQINAQQETSEAASSSVENDVKSIEVVEDNTVSLNEQENVSVEANANDHISVNTPTDVEMENDDAIQGKNNLNINVDDDVMIERGNNTASEHSASQIIDTDPTIDEIVPKNQEENNVENIDDKLNSIETEKKLLEEPKISKIEKRDVLEENDTSEIDASNSKEEINSIKKIDDQNIKTDNTVPSADNAATSPENNLVVEENKSETLVPSEDIKQSTTSAYQPSPENIADSSLPSSSSSSNTQSANAEQQNPSSIRANNAHHHPTLNSKQPEQNQQLPVPSQTPAHSSEKTNPNVSPQQQISVSPSSGSDFPHVVAEPLNHGQAHAQHSAHRMSNSLPPHLRTKLQNNPTIEQQQQHLNRPNIPIDSNILPNPSHHHPPPGYPQNYHQPVDPTAVPPAGYLYPNQPSVDPNHLPNANYLNQGAAGAVPNQLPNSAHLNYNPAGLHQHAEPNPGYLNPNPTGVNQKPVPNSDYLNQNLNTNPAQTPPAHVNAFQQQQQQSEDVSLNSPHHQQHQPVQREIFNNNNYQINQAETLTPSAEPNVNNSPSEVKESSLIDSVPETKFPVSANNNIAKRRLLAERVGFVSVIMDIIPDEVELFFESFNISLHAIIVTSIVGFFWCLMKVFIFFVNSSKKVRELRDSNCQTQRKLYYLEAENDKIKEEINLYLSEFKNCKDNLNKIEKRKCQIEFENETLKNEINILKNDNISLKTQADSNPQISSKLLSVLAEAEQLKQNNIELNLKLDELTKQIDSHLSTIKNYEKTISSDQEEIKNIKEELSLKSEEIENLNETIKESEQKFNIVQLENTNLKELQNKLTEEMKEMKDELLSSEEKAKHFEEEYKSSKAQLESLEQKVFSLSQELETKDTEIYSMQTLLSKLNKNINKERGQRQRRSTDINGDMTDVNGDSEVTVDPNVSNDDETNNQEDAICLQNVVQLQLRLTQLEREKEHFRNKYEEAQKQLEQAKNDVDNIKKSNQLLKEGIEKATDERLKAVIELEVLTKHYKEKEREYCQDIGVNKVKLEQQTEDVESLNSSLKVIQEENTILKDKEKSFKKELEETELCYKSQLNQLEKQAYENWIAARSAERKCEELKAEAAALRRTLSQSIKSPPPGEPSFGYLDDTASSVSSLPDLFNNSLLVPPPPPPPPMFFPPMMAPPVPPPPPSVIQQQHAPPPQATTLQFESTGTSDPNNANHSGTTFWSAPPMSHSSNVSVTLSNTPTPALPSSTAITNNNSSSYPIYDTPKSVHDSTMTYSQANPTGIAVSNVYHPQQPPTPQQQQPHQQQQVPVPTGHHQSWPQQYGASNAPPYHHQYVPHHDRSSFQ